MREIGAYAARMSWGPFALDRSQSRVP